mmetsp:Transcript_6319/g.15743  ORF Transcript_6319/g.15743 Transcript_6319/m.15743 type:complete len:249 (+) Transcript_6319:19-765(+)
MAALGSSCCCASMAQPVEVRDFRFASSDDLYGFVTVGAKVCELVPRSLAYNLGVRPGWYVAAVDEQELPGAMRRLVRRVPAVSTDVVRDLLRSRRAEAVRRGGASVKLTFWTSPAPCLEEREEDEGLEADSVDELKRILVEMYGSVYTAWNEALDKDGSGQLSYPEFVAACREVGFSGSLKRVYQELDKDNSGVISINELDPTCAMDFAKGRCVVCTLPNPCQLHVAEEQRMLALENRTWILRGEEVP